RRLKRIHELSVLLDAARSLHLTDSDERQRCTLKSELEPPSGWLPETVAACDVEAREREVLEFLRTLRHGLC
ncbi:MAG TPA: hypothetical protein VGK73_22600, partial [Polyangiaceae bacterium]